MMIYAAPFVFALIAALACPRSRAVLAVLLVSTFALVAFRGPVDPDYHTYIRIYELAPSLLEGWGPLVEYYRLISMEPAFIALNVWLKTLDAGYRWILVFYAFASVGFMALLCRHVPANPFFTFAFLYASSFVGLWIQIRFGAACLGVLLAAVLYARQYHWLSLGTLLVATLFHAVAWTAVLAWLLFALMSLRGMSRPVVIGLAAAGFVVISFIQFADLLALLLVTINERYEAYAGSATGSRLSFFVRIAVFGLLFALIDKAYLRFASCRLMLAFAFCTLLVWAFAWQIEILYRLGVLFELGFCFFLVPAIYANVYRYAAAVCTLMLLMAWRLRSAIGELQPYVPVFSMGQG